MVRNYKKKKQDPSYSAELLRDALRKIENEGLSIRSAAKRYEIPFSTLQKHLRGTRGAKSTSKGRPTAIPAGDEEKLVNAIKTMEKWGWGLNRKEILELVGKYVKDNNVKTPFKDGIPGEDWFLAFKERHRLSLKKPQGLEYARKKANDPFVIEQYFDILKETLERYDLQNKPSQIYNIDETSFTLDPSRTKIVGQKNAPASRITTGPGRESTTVLMGGNANGDKLPPLIVFKGKNIWDTWMAPDESTFPGTSYAASPNGWMETEIFVNYFTKTFIPNVISERPILLLYDGHSTHLDQKLIEAAVENNVVVLKLPPHSSHLLQPMDLAVFKSLKSRWDSKLAEFQRKHVGIKIPKKDFSVLVGSIWKDTDPALLTSGFRKGGIYPFNRSVIDRTKYDPEALRRYEEHLKNPQPATQAPLNEPSTSTQEDPPREHPTMQQLEPERRPEPIAGPSKKRVSFEELLLETVRQSPRPYEKERKKKSAPGAEVITEKQNIEKKKKAEQEREDARKAKEDARKAKDEIKKVKDLAKKANDESKKRKIKNSTVSSSSDEDEPHILSDDESDEATFEDYANRLEEEEKALKEDELLFKGLENVKVGSWVLVSFKGKKSILFYVGQITALDEESQSTIMFLKKSHPNSHDSVFHWPEQEDHHTVATSDIELLLPEPLLGRRGELTFPVSFTSYNVK